MFSKPSFFIFILALLCVIVPSNAGQSRIHRSKARLSRRQGFDSPQTFTTVTTTTTDAGVVTQTCQVTMTPFVNEEGVNLVRETKSCSIVVTPPAGDAPAAPSGTTTAAESATETASATESASATETGSATTTTESATATESLVATESATETVSATETASATESAATTESVALTESASFTESASPTETATQATETAITTTESTVAATESAAATTESASAIPETTTASAPAVTESSSAPSESIATPSPSPSVAPTGTGDNGAIPIGTSMVNRESLVTTNPVVTATTPAGAGASPSAPAEASASVSGSAAAAEGTQDSFELPGKKLEVLPIGLGVFAGISVIALIVVGLVTYERTKYRKAFRQRTMAQSGAPMAYGGMAERA